MTTIREARQRLTTAALALGDKLARNANAKTDDEARELEAAAVAYRAHHHREAQRNAVLDGLAELAAAPIESYCEATLAELEGKVTELRKLFAPRRS